MAKQEKVVTTIHPQIKKLSTMLHRSAATKVKHAAELVEAGLKTKEIKDQLKELKVSSQVIGDFLKLFRFYAKGKSLGYTNAQLVNTKAGVARQISKILEEGECPSKDSWDLATEGKGKAFKESLSADHREMAGIKDDSDKAKADAQNKTISNTLIKAKDNGYTRDQLIAMVDALFNVTDDSEDTADLTPYDETATIEQVEAEAEVAVA